MKSFHRTALLAGFGAPILQLRTASRNWSEGQNHSGIDTKAFIANESCKRRRRLAWCGGRRIEVVAHSMTDVTGCGGARFVPMAADNGVVATTIERQGFADCEAIGMPAWA
jgi:hypothetical protein